MALRACGVRALAVDGEVVVAPEDLGAVIGGAAEALYTRERCARRLRGEERGRVERAVEGFTDDAAHGAAAFDSGKRSKSVEAWNAPWMCPPKSYVVNFTFPIARSSEATKRLSSD